MAPSAAYYEWVDAGQPYEPARPVIEFVTLLRGKGYTVYHKGDTPHMQANPPEDHTPFSATGWPVESKRWVGHALDIMPGGGPLTLPQLARRIIRDRDNRVYGTRWIKYLNWTDELGICRHESWANATETRSTSPSTDKGHIHISCRSDMDLSIQVKESGWDPTEDAMSLTPGQQYVLHVINNRIDGLASGKETVTVPSFVASDGKTYPALTNTNATAAGIRKLVELMTPDALAAALAAALEANPEIVDALATAVAGRVGLIPTAREIAKAIGELNWHGTSTE